MPILMRPKNLRYRRPTKGILGPDILPERKTCAMWRVRQVAIGDGTKAQVKMVIDPAGWVTFRQKGKHSVYSIPLAELISLGIIQAQRRECERRLGTAHRELDGGADSGGGAEAEGGGSDEGHDR